MNAFKVGGTPVDIGISQVSQQPAIEKNEFNVDQSWRVPPGTPASHLTKLYDANTIAHQIENFLKPDDVKWYLLVPVKFKMLRRELLKRLMTGKVNADNTDERLVAAANLLAEEERNCELVDRYRFALVKA